MQPQRDPAAERATAEALTLDTRVEREIVPVLWELYYEAFEPLRELALLNHLYPRELFDELINDPRVWKVIEWRGPDPVGFAILTSFLELVPQISPPFLRKRFPEQALRHTIYFGIFICVAPGYRNKRVFARIIAGMGQIAAMHDGIVVCDMSKVNRDLALPDMIDRIVTWFPRSAFEEIDSQHYFAAILPEPMQRLPFSRTPMPRPVIDLRDTGAIDDRDAATADYDEPTRDSSSVSISDAGTGRPKR
jgi:hypothetical protein